MGARAPRAASRRTTNVPGARRTSRKRRYAELKGVIDVLVSLPVRTGRKLAPWLLQPGCCGVVGSGPSATRDSRHTVTHVTKTIIAPMPAGWHRLVRFNPCACLGTLWPVREQLTAPRPSVTVIQPCSSACADSQSIVWVQQARGLRLTRVRGVPLAGEALSLDDLGIQRRLQRPARLR